MNSLHVQYCSLSLLSFVFQALLGRIESLQKMCSQKDKFLQSTKMILKFRETHIANLEKNKGSDNEQDAAVVSCA